MSRTLEQLRWNGEPYSHIMEGNVKIIIKLKRGVNINVTINAKIADHCLALLKQYSHEIIKHNLGIFKKGSYHTNGIEGFWGLLKRGIIGIYQFTSDKHLQRYCDEFAYRYNIRSLSQGEQFNLTLINSDERLSYKQLIA